MENERPIPILYSPLQIAVASFIGSPLAGCWFFSCNCRELGNVKDAWRWLAIGGVMIAALFVMAFLLPGFPSVIVPCAYSAGFDIAARRVHGEAFARHAAAGGRFDSWCTVLGLSLLFLSAGVVVFWSAIIACQRLVGV